ncbi:MAG: hypothetical protein CK424_05615 [Legionella sp.]|nr:MAG: hypothetical protein CK424_05615 [Legionella sp.]
MTQINIDLIVSQLNRFVETKQRLQLIDEILPTLRNYPDLEKFLKFAQIEYTKKIAVELQLYKLAIREHYSTLETPLPSNMTDKLIALPLEIDVTVCVSNITTILEVSRVLSGQQATFGRNVSFLYKELNTLFISRMRFLDKTCRFLYKNMRFLYDILYGFYTYLGKVYANLVHIKNTIFLWMNSIENTEVVAWIGFNIYLVILFNVLSICDVLVIVSLIYKLVGLVPILNLSADDFQQKTLPNLDAIILDFGSITQLQYASIGLQEKYAQGLQPIGLINKAFIKDFELSSIMRYHPEWVLTLLKSQLAIKDILAFIVKLPPGVVSDHLLNQLIIDMVTLHHGVNAMQKLQDAVDTYESTNSSEQFSLACIHRSGLFGLQQNHAKAIQSFKKIDDTAPNYAEAKIELTHMMLKDNWREAFDHCNSANKRNRNPSEDTVITHLKEAILGWKDEEMIEQVTACNR